MATVRQLTTRFSFETDRSGIRRFNQSLRSMKRGVAGLATAFGATKVVKSLVRLGTGMEMSVVRAQRFSKEVRFLKNNTVRLTGAMARAWQNVREAIPGRVILSDFLNGFADFKQFIKGGTMDQFNKLFIAAGRIAKISGEPVAEVFRSLQEAAKSGDLTILQKVFKGIDVKDVAMQNFINQLRNVDPRGIATIDDRINGFFRVLKANEKELDQFSRRVVFGTFGGQFNEFKLNLRDMGEVIGAKLTRPMKDALKWTNEFFMEWSRSGYTWKGLVRTMGKRSSIFGAILKGLGDGTGAIATALDKLFEKMKDGFDKLDEMVRKRGLAGTGKLILYNIDKDVKDWFREKGRALGLVPPKGTSNYERMQALSHARARVDVMRKRGVTGIKASVSRPGEIVIVNAPITIQVAKGQEETMAESISRILGRNIKNAKNNFGRQESGKLSDGVR